MRPTSYRRKMDPTGTLLYHWIAGDYAWRVAIFKGFDLKGNDNYILRLYIVANDNPDDDRKYASAYPITTPMRDLKRRASNLVRLLEARYRRKGAK